MATPVTPTAEATPPRTSAAFGALRVRALHAALLGRPAPLPASCAAELTAWADEFAGGRAEGVGLDPTGVDDGWLDTLGWIGIPFARGGALRWGVDVRPKLSATATATAPEIRDGVLWVPDQPGLRALSSLALKPARQYIGARLGCRLQAAAGVHLFQWPKQVLLVSRCEVPIGGFLHGPDPGMRASVAIDPGSFQVLRW